MLEATCLGGLKTKCVARSCFCVSETWFLLEYQLTPLHKYGWGRCLSLFHVRGMMEHSTGQATPLLQKSLRAIRPVFSTVAVKLHFLAHNVHCSCAQSISNPTPVVNRNCTNILRYSFWNYFLPAAQPRCCAGQRASWCRSCPSSSWHP